MEAAVTEIRCNRAVLHHPDDFVDILRPRRPFPRLDHLNRTSIATKLVYRIPQKSEPDVPANVQDTSRIPTNAGHFHCGELDSVRRDNVLHLLVLHSFHRASQTRLNNFL